MTPWVRIGRIGESPPTTTFASLTLADGTPLQTTAGERRIQEKPWR
jgi:hypothetical protein